MRIRKLLVFALLLLATVVQAQQMPKIPVDKAVRIGKLPNGLTYYIRHNDWPENVANFYIAQRVGSINENDDQRGLAHFLEHMAFNGSEHFPDNNLIEYTRSLGVEFGGDLNAYTSVDQTVYRVCNVPTKRQSSLDSCLLILKDWSNGLTLNPKEIDKERGVIHQEWRLRSSPGMRMIERALPQFYPGSKYGYRMPIGLMSIIDNFKPKFLVDYYHKWYRPDNQAIIVVGDVDVDKIEAEIKKLWAGVTVPKNAAKVIDEPVPDNNTPIYIVEKDKEQPYSSVSIAIKHDAIPDSAKTGLDYLMDGTIKGLITSMLNSRLAEMSQKADCPFTGAGVSYGDYMISKTKDAFSFDASAKDGKELQTLAAGVRELERVRRFGFTATEFARAKADLISAMDKAYSNRNKITNSQYGDQYRDNYLSNEPIPSMEEEYGLFKMYAPMLTVDIANQYAKQLITKSDTNLVAYIFMQEKAGKTYPTDADIANTIKAARAENITAYVDNVKNEPLIAKLPAKGSVKSTKENKQFGYKELTLSNGIRVILKKTDYKADQVVMIAKSKGGKSLYGDKDFTNLKYTAGAVEAGGLGNFLNNELQKALAGKQCGVSFSLSNYSQSISGQTVPKDMETMLQLTYLYFTALKKDTTSFNAYVTALRQQLANKNLSPEAVFSDSVNCIVNGYQKRFAPADVKDLSHISYDRMLQIARERLANPGQFTFYFVGNYDEKTIIPLIEQYIASLPSTGKKENYKQLKAYADGKIDRTISRKMETPKCISLMLWREKMPYTLANSVLVDAAGQVLSMEYLKQIREDASAAYSVGANGGLSRNGKESFAMMQAYCPMDPAKREQAVGLLKSIIKDCSVKVDPDKVKKVKDYMLKQADVAVKTNGYWMGIITEYDEYKLDFHTEYKKCIEALTPAAIANFFKGLLSSGNDIEVTLVPEK